MNPIKIITWYKRIALIIIAFAIALFIYLGFVLFSVYGQQTQDAVTAMSSNDPIPTQSPITLQTLTATRTSFPPATATLVPTNTPTSPPTITPTPATLNPLTGLPVADPMNLERRPVMIKVSNWPATGRPHAGLTSADLVFEYYIGYAKSRFLALYYSQDSPKIGPVRSGRMVDPQLTNLYGGIFAYGNADPKVDAVILPSLGERALAFKYLPCPPMCGVDTHDATGVFADSAATTDYAIQKGINNQKPNLSGMFFDPAAPENAMVGTWITFRFADWSMTEWHYDPDSQRYLWWMENNDGANITMAPMTDRNTGLQVGFDNIIVIYAQYIEYAPTLHDINISTVTTPQPAVFFRNGAAIQGTWHVPDPYAPMAFSLADGTPYALKPGKTWIFIAGINTQLSHDNPGAWLFDFYQ